MAASLGEAVLELRTDSSGLNSGLDKAESRLKSTGAKMTSFGKGLTAAVTLPIAAIGAASFKLASDAAESTAKFTTVFGAVADDMDDWISGLMETVPSTREELQSMTSGLQDLLVPMGVIPGDATEMNKQFIALAGDLASFNNIPVEDALNKIRSGLVGSSEPLREFGVNVSVAAVEAKAAELGLIGYGDKLKDLDRDSQGAIRAQSILAIVTEESNFAIGDAARTADSTANSMKFLWRDLNELSTKIGTILIPAITPIIQKLQEWVEWLGTLDTDTSTWIVGIGAVAAALGPLLLIAGQVITAISSMSGVIYAIVGFLTGPVGIVVAVTAVVVALGAWFSQTETGNELFAALWDVLGLVWDILTNLVSVIADAVMPVFWDLVNIIKDWLKPYFEKVTKDLKTLRDGLEKFGKWLGLVSDDTEELADAQEDLEEKLDDTETKTKDATKTFKPFKTGLNDVEKQAKDTAAEMKELADKVKGLIDAERAAGPALVSIGDELGEVDLAIKDVIQAESDLQEENDALASQLWTTLNVAMADSNLVFDDAIENIQTMGVSLTGEGGLTSKVNAAGDSLGTQISTIVNDVSQSLVDMVFEWNFSWQSLIDGFKTIGEGVLRSITEHFIGPLTEKLSKVITDFVSGFLGIGGQIAGGAAGGVGGAAPSVPGVPGGGGGGGAPGVPSGGGVLPVIGAMSGIVGAIGSALGAYQAKRAADRLFLIDVKMAGLVGNTTGANLIGNEIVRQNWLFHDHLTAIRSMMGYIEDTSLVKILAAQAPLTVNIQTMDAVNMERTVRTRIIPAIRDRERSMRG